jgi:hypothetical protein
VPPVPVTVTARTPGWTRSSHRPSSSGGPERREVHLEPVAGDLEDALRLFHVLELVEPQIDERGIDRFVDEACRDLGQHDLAAVGRRHQARTAIEGGSEVVRLAALHRPGVEPHTHGERAERAPIFSRERQLPGDCRFYAVRGICEGRINGVADRLEHHASPIGDGSRKQFEVSRDLRGVLGGMLFE